MFGRRCRVLLGVEGIADGGADAKNVVGVKFVRVIYDAIVMSLGANKEVSPYSVLDAATHMQEEMSAV